MDIGGRQRKVVMTANRNGFFYVLDRTTGEFLSGKPYIKQTWAKEIGQNGRPIELPDQRPTPKGTTTCPDLFGGTNFMSPSFDPSTGLFYVSARETYQLGAPIYGAPSSYQIDNRQYIIMPAGSTLTAFALPR